MLLANQLRASGLPCFPCRPDKAPAVPRGVSWATMAAQPVDSQAWPCGVVGVPVPPGVLILDVDQYKGVTRAAIEAALGLLDWEAAHIQTTMNGGQHYAFQHPGYDIANTSNVGGVTGLDTRTPGSGYICTGDGYTPHGAGLYRLTAPDSLPRLPDSARATLERASAKAPPPPGTTPAQHSETDPDTVRDALRHIDPGCARAEWVRVGMALRAGFADDEATGALLFEEWSAGELWPGGEPDNYQPDGPGGSAHQFGTFKPEGDTTLGTLFYEAIQGGWRPPSGVDTAAAFGPGAAAPAEWHDLIGRIQEEGGNPDLMPALRDAIAAMACTPLQRATLHALLQRELKEAGLLTPALRRETAAPAAGAVPGQYGKNHTINASVYLTDHHGGGETLIHCEQDFYQYNGKVWQPTTDGAMAAAVTRAMLASQPQDSTIAGTVKLIGKIVHSHDTPPSPLQCPGVVVFNNGVLDVASGVLQPHSPDWRTTCLLPYDYNPAAQCPEWQRFLAVTFSGDAERIALLQEWFGYMLVPGYDFHKILLLIGAGRSGKGTIGRVLSLLVGAENFTGASLRSVVSDSKLVAWRHKTVAFIGDAQSNVHPNIRDGVIEALKQISGNDAIDLERKYKDAVSVTLPTRITMAANGLPRLFDDSGALAGRIMPLPTDGTHYGREDPGLFDRLAAEVEGITQWALEGRARLYANGRFTDPAASQGEREYMEESYSPVAQFVDACVRYTPGGTAVVTAKELHACYLAWCSSNDNDEKRLTQRTLTGAVKQAVAAKGVRYGRYRTDTGDQARGFRGMALMTPSASAFGGQLEAVQ